jgi:hypothetical protein
MFFAPLLAVGRGGFVYYTQAVGKIGGRPFKMYHDAGKYLYEWMVSHGINPLVGAALISLSFLFLRRKDIPRLRSLAPGRRRELIMLIIFTSFAVIVAFTEVAGLLPKEKTHQIESATSRDTTHFVMSPIDSVPYVPVSSADSSSPSH